MQAWKKPVVKKLMHFIWAHYLCSLNLKSPLPSPIPSSCSFLTSSWIHLNPYGKPRMKASLSVMLCTFTVWLCMRAALPYPSLTDLFFQGIFFYFLLLSELLLLIMCNWGKSEKQGQLLLISTGEMKRVHPGTQRGGSAQIRSQGFSCVWQPTLLNVNGQGEQSRNGSENANCP